MTDVVVTVPKKIWLDWLEEGDLVDQPATGEEWGFSTGGGMPTIKEGERVYVVAHGLLRGYAPLTRAVKQGKGVMLCRKAQAVAVTILAPIQGFRGWRYRWWDQDIEKPFPDWRTKGVLGIIPCTACQGSGIHPVGRERCFPCLGAGAVLADELKSV